MPNHVAMRGCLLFGLSFTAQARDPASLRRRLAEAQCPVSGLLHLKRPALQRGKGRQDQGASSVLGLKLCAPAIVNSPVDRSRCSSPSLVAAARALRR